MKDKEEFGEIRDIHEDAEWYASYMNDDQGVALVKCQQLKIKQLTELIEVISGEIELCEKPKEVHEINVLESIKSLIKQNKDKKVKYTKNYFKWIG
jgi:nitrogen-specific signal transduction histidine kinase